MSSTPLLGLGASALLAWADTQKPATHKDLAARIGVTKAAFHEWVTAGWFDGGAVPKAIHREQIEVVSDGQVPAQLFAQDDKRRESAKREARPS